MNKLASLTKEKNSIHEQSVKKETAQIKSLTDELQLIERRASERLSLVSGLETLSDDSFNNALLHKMDQLFVKLEKL